MSVNGLPGWGLLHSLLSRRGRHGGNDRVVVHSPAGFAETMEPVITSASPERHAAVMAATVERVARAMRGEMITPPPDVPPFPSTGPQGHRSRMRDKLLNRGPEALADYEMLEMLLFFVQPKGDTKPLAKMLINRFGSYANVLVAPQQALLDCQGVGPHTVAALKLVHASALRLARAEVINRPVLNNWDRLIDYLTAALAREQIEQFRVLFLDTRNRLLADEAQGRGTVNHTPVYPREVIKRALELQATAIILVHNHPSGDPTPSRDDIDMTRAVEEAAAALSIVLHDHIIIGNGRATSFRREGFLG